MLCAVAISGCSYKLASLVSTGENEPQSTGTISSPASASLDTLSASPQAELDLAYARAAVAEVLSRGGKDASVPWRNPQSGARGNVTPLATSYSEAGMPAAISLRATYMANRTTGWRGLPAGPQTAPGRSGD
jgi:hypothetical protein